MILAMAKRKHPRPTPAKPEPIPQPRPWPLLAVMLFAAVLYLGTLRAGLIWDDHNLVEMHAGRTGASDFARLWTSDFWQTGPDQPRSQYYRPLTTTSFLLDQLLYGPSPRGFHLTNLILYALTCGLAFLLFRRLLQSPSLALGLGLAFAALPAHTENVAWVSGRTDLVCALFMFAALLLYLRADASNRAGLWAASVALFVLSLFGKEMSISLVAVVALHQLLEHGFNRRALLRLLPYALAAVLFAVLHALAAHHTAPENVYTTPLAYSLNVIRNLGLGIWFSLIPGGFHYLVTATREQAGQTFPLPQGVRLALLVGLAPATALGAILFARRRQRLLALAFGSGLIALLPVSGLLPIGVIFALRFLLIPSFFFLLALGALLQQAARPLPFSRFTLAPAAWLAPLIALYAAFTWTRVPDWRDDASLMRSVLRQAPDAALAHFILGNALAGQGQVAEAGRHYEQALKSRPGYPEAEFNLGVLEERSGRLAQAEERYRSALAHAPAFRPARLALARLLQARGRNAEAADLRRGYSLPPPRP